MFYFRFFLVCWSPEIITHRNSRQNSESCSSSLSREHNLGKITVEETQCQREMASAWEWKPLADSEEGNKIFETNIIDPDSAWVLPGWKSSLSLSELLGLLYILARSSIENTCKAHQEAYYSTRAHADIQNHLLSFFYHWQFLPKLTVLYPIFTTTTV